jgi:target of rapamycin complex 2 subunit MAPKAP1
MPVRTRAGSSPLRSTLSKDGPSVMVTSPSKPPESDRLRRGSLGALEAVKERARRDTVTSSEMSSENELDPSLFKRKQLHPSRPGRPPHLLSQRIEEDEKERDVEQDSDEGADSDNSSLSSEFVGSADSVSLLEEEDATASSPVMQLTSTLPLSHTSPKKNVTQPNLLQPLPPPRPISTIQPVSALTAALKGKGTKSSNPVQRFAILSGKDDPSPLWIKIYVPTSSKPSKPIEMALKRMTDNGANSSKVIVAEAIGHALWRYQEDNLEPKLPAEKLNVNKWVLRMYEDGEVEDEFPPLTRTKAIIDFASNNTRPMRMRMRDKPWDEFALVEATASEQRENETQTPNFNISEDDVQDEAEATPASNVASSSNSNKAATSVGPGTAPVTIHQGPKPFYNPITRPMFGSKRVVRPLATLADAPAAPVSHAVPRSGATKVLRVHYVDVDNFQTHNLPFEVTTDTYIAEVFDRACRELNLDKALYIVKVSGTSTMAPFDRTVEALGNRADLDIHRRRFVTDGAFGLSGSPGSESPGAPLLINSGGTPKKGKKGHAAIAAMAGGMHPLTHPLLSSTNTYKRWQVTRKQAMSFSSSSSRILCLDGEYMHIMPASSAGAAASKGGQHQWLEGGPGKTTSVHFSSIIGAKVRRRHPKSFCVVIWRERESKRYDFDAANKEEAEEIVREIKKGVGRFQDGGN